MQRDPKVQDMGEAHERLSATTRHHAYPAGLNTA
jgi:hypothetical protein